MRPWFVGLFLFCSGTAALVYQTVWLREFRLIFGASTYATAAVLAIFMAGLGAGSAILGRRADLREAPLAFYGILEISIAISAAVSPLLIVVARKLYIGLGGSVTLGLGGATVLRLILSTLVLALPTFLMGGTLPAAARAVERADDPGRRRVAVLYGLNTLGAVTGTMVSTFYLLERLGQRKTLLLAALLNLAVGVCAVAIGRRRHGVVQTEIAESAAESEAMVPAAELLPRSAVLASSAIAGFAFLLMELVWYRMLTPLLGGTTFTFGLILAVALLGIGLGGGAYSFSSARSSPGAGAFAVTCTLEAAAVILPFALGDRLAVLANLLRGVTRIGFAGSLIAWTIVTMIVVLPAAFISGIQFPILISLLGRGRRDVGRDVGAAYAWNTAGAIAGSLAGGFGLMPLLTAPGCWRLVAGLLLALGIAIAVYSLRDRAFGTVAFAMVAAATAFSGLLSLGPTAAWRHSEIGAGRADTLTSRNSIGRWIRLKRSELQWEQDGRESTIAVMDSNDRAFVANGKTDGSAHGDASTQVMSGIIGALIHPNLRRSLVIGLGTGSTAGWLGGVPGMERVDVVELEPAVLRVARDNAAVNRDAMRNPRIQIRIADAREVLLTTPQHYDLIFSEPSNPYRAGIASLYTREFYESAADRLNRGGVFLQWVQAYEIDARTLRTIYATLARVFPHVETWRTNSSDLVLIASREPLVYDADLIRARLRQTGYARPLHVGWRFESVEGFFSNYVGNERLSRALGAAELNSDDRTLIEFGFARTLGEKALNVNQLIEAARAVEAERPLHVRGRINWNDVELNRWHDKRLEMSPLEQNQDVRARVEFTRLWSEGNLAAALAVWQRHSWSPLNTTELSRLGEVFAEAGLEQAVTMTKVLSQYEPVEADAILARLRLRQHRHTEARDALLRALVAYRHDPWPEVLVMGRALDSAALLAATVPADEPALFDAMSKPFAVAQWEMRRREALVYMAYTAGQCSAQTIAALLALEPDFPWETELLRIRLRCYRQAGLSDFAVEAERDWDEYQQNEPEPLLVPE